jgi:hypothetical protein
MRTLILALTAVTAFTAGGILVGSTEPGAPTDPIQKRQIRSGGLAGIGQGGFLRGGAYDSFARGDMMGDGGGAKMGSMGGDMMGNMGGDMGNMGMGPAR